MNANERDARILQKIAKYCREIDGFIAGIGYLTFEETLEINRASIFTLEQIGECVKSLSEDFKKAHAQIPWQEIIGMRNRMVHDYEGIFLDIVWETITEDIPKLHDYIVQVLNESVKNKM